MYILSLILLTISVYMFCSNPKSGLRRWFAAFLFFVALGVLAAGLYESNTRYPIEKLARWAYINLSTYLFMESNCFMPYALMVLAVTMTKKFRSPGGAASFPIKLLLLAPIAVMHILTPPWRPFNVAYFTSLYAPWSLFYYMLAPVLAFSAWMHENEKNVRLKKMIMFCFVSMASAVTTLTGYVLPWAYKNNFYGLMRYAILIIIVICAFVALKYGMLGLRLRIEREHYNTMTGSMTPGAALLSHSIKNEIIKIALCADNIGNGNGGENPYIKENIGIINNSVAHLSEMTRRIRLQVQDYELNESSCRLQDLAEEALSLVEPSFRQKNITIVKDYSADIYLICDRLHLCEVLVNLLTNAAEALNENGRIEISTSARKQGACVTVRDNGKGISRENMPFIFNPFFTTKNQKQNYGLGLSYCYGAMKKHGASIRIKSGDSGGTEVCLAFPKRRTASLTIGGGDGHGQDSANDR